MTLSDVVEEGRRYHIHVLIAIGDDRQRSVIAMSLVVGRLVEKQVR